MSACRLFPSFALTAALAVFMPAGTLSGAGLPPQTFEKFTGLSGSIPDGAVDGEGNFVFVTANALHKYNHFGSKMFSEPLTMTPAALVPGPGGEIYLAGSVAADGASDLALAKYGASGQLEWLQKAGGPGNDEGLDIAMDDQGGIYAAGFTTVDQADFFVVKYNAAGAQQWTRRFSGAANGDDAADFLTAVPGGGVTACGLARNPSEGFLTIRYDGAGTALWTSFYDAPGVTESRPAGMVRTSDGGFAVAGKSGAAPTVVKYSESGGQLWATVVPDTTGIGAVAPGPDGSAAVITMGLKYPNDIGFPLVGRVAVSGVSGTGVGWSQSLGDLESLGGVGLVAGEGGGYYASAGQSSRYHTRDARLAGMKAGGSDLAIDLLPGFTSGVSGMMTVRVLATGADGSVWAIYEGPLSSDLLLRRYGTPLPPPVPGVVTGPVQDLLPSSVVLTGSIDPKGAEVQWRFEYGLTTAYGTVTPLRQPGGTAGESVSETVEELTPGTVYHYRLVATNITGTYAGEDRDVQTPSEYQAWAVAMFGSSDAPGSGPLEDPDQDGGVNLVEYALGTEGNVSNRGAGLPVFERWKDPDSGVMFSSLVYRPDATHTGITITPLASGDLINWSDDGIFVIHEPGGVRRALASENQRFMRLKVTLP